MGSGEGDENSLSHCWKHSEDIRMMANLLTIVSAVVAALGGLIYGVDSGIIATTIGHDTFKLYMFGPSMSNTALVGALVSVYNAGQSVGSASVGYLADRFSRKYTISFAAFLGQAPIMGKYDVILTTDSNRWRCTADRCPEHWNDDRGSSHCWYCMWHDPLIRYVPLLLKQTSMTLTFKQCPFTSLRPATPTPAASWSACKA